MEPVPDYTSQHTASFIKKISVPKKKSVELNTELSDIVELLSGTNYLLQFIL